MRVVVVGAGSWGSTFAALLAERDHDVWLACRDPEQARAIAETGRNPRYVADADLSRVRPCADGEAREALEAAELVCIAVPSAAFRQVVMDLPKTGAPVLSLVKGFDPASGRRLSTVVTGRPVAVLAGPNHAEEIALRLPAVAVIASADEALARRLQEAIISPRFRVYTNRDIVGVEVSTATKNVIALAVGMNDGLGLGDNAKAAVVTRGLAEIRRIGRALDGRPETFSGLAGMGDLMVTCWSRHSRNRRAGELIAQGRSPEEAVREIGMTVEGITTAPVLRDLGRRLGVDLPITEAVCAVLEGGDPHEIGPELMQRTPKHE
jgi:glycerol-3-phosphate dehydrogenase (NAD(P)+)